MNSLLLAVLAVFAFVSCGDKDKTKKPDPEDIGIAALNGTWNTNCLPNSTPYSGPLGERRVVQIDGSDVKTSYVLFRDENCSDAQVQLTIVKHSTVHFSDVSHEMESTGLYSVDDSVSNYGIIPANPDYADVLSRSEFCYYKKWKAGTEFKVTGRNCGDRIMFTATTLYTILRHDNTTKPETFVLGRYSENEDGSTPQTRPKSLGGDRHFRTK